MNIVTKTVAAIAFASLSFAAQATVVTTLSGGTALTIPGTGNIVYTNNQTIAPGITVTSTASGVYGYTGGYGFSSNGSWTGTPMIGTNSSTGYFQINFANAVSGFLSDVNWSTSFGVNATIAIYGVAGNLLESLTLENGANLVAADAYYGFTRATNDIAFIRFSNEYIGIRDLSYERTTNVPEPASLTLLGMGFAGLALARRRRR